jgi:L-iditol 2-dehydrogenase
LGSPYWYPLLLGHEGAGEIVKTGEKVLNYAVGEHVINPESHLIKSESYYCPYGGQFVEYTVVTDVAAAQADGVELPQKTYGARKVAKEIPFVDAAAMVSLCEMLSGLHNMEFQPGNRVLIYGDGSNGAGLASLARLLGADWVGVAGHHDGRLRHIKSCGKVDEVYNTKTCNISDVIPPRSLDLVIDAAGRSRLLIEGSKLVRIGGTFALYAILGDEDCMVNFNEIAMHINIFKNCLPYGNMAVIGELEGLILSGKMHPSDIYSHVLPVEEFGKALEMTRSREAIKVVLTFD